MTKRQGNTLTEAEPFVFVDIARCWFGSIYNRLFAMSSKVKLDDLKNGIHRQKSKIIQMHKYLVPEIQGVLVSN